MRPHNNSHIFYFQSGLLASRGPEEGGGGLQHGEGGRSCRNVALPPGDSQDEERLSEETDTGGIRGLDADNKSLQDTS